MRREQSLTPLQLGVLNRLEQAGYISLAEWAHDAWSHGERCDLPNVISPRDAELSADYERANMLASQ